MLKMTRLHILWAGVLLLLVGCAGNQRLQTRLMSDADTNICNVAVLPFENWTQKSELTLLAGRMFASQLIQSKAFNTVQEGDVGMFLLRQRLLPGNLLYKEHYAALENQLDIDAVIQGRIVEAGSYSQRGGRRIPLLSLYIDMYDARSGKLLLNSVHQRRGDEYRKVMHFGVVTTNSGLIEKMSREIINDWFSKGVTCR
ncbi:hypothetical protein [Malonomonas rubra]|uniref:hypothetical protein n=1 Tax=Malonomonas rubra TaxID=57040 RepID=UPI0026F22240|nr:hypothetical protein [Malonomonas rubra]